MSSAAALVEMFVRSDFLSCVSHVASLHHLWLQLSAMTVCVAQDEFTEFLRHAVAQQGTLSWFAKTSGSPTCEN